MMLITRYLSGPKSESPDARLRALSLLIEGIAVQAFDLDNAGRAEFQAEVRAIGEAIERDPDPEKCLLATGQVLQAIQQYHRGTEQLATARRRECQSIIDLLTGSLLRLSKSTGQTAENLRDLEKQVERATALEDVRAVHAEMKQLISRIHNEAELQDLRSQTIKTDLAAATIPTRRDDEAAPALDTDELTGLRSAREAERAIRRIPDDGKLVFPIVFFVERLDLINKRYGFKAGDQILVTFSQHLAQKMRTEDRLFRWRGPTFIALFPRDNSTDIRNELRRFAAKKLEHTVDVGGRKVMLTISAAVGIMPSSAETGPQEILNRIESFVAEQSSRTLIVPQQSQTF